MCRGTLLEEHCYTACTERADFCFSHDSCQRISLGLFPSDSPHPLVASAEPSPLCVSLTPSAMAGPKPVVLTGPSGAGKSTLLKKLMKEFDNVFGFSVSRKCAFGVCCSGVSAAKKASGAFRRWAACVFKVARQSKPRKHNIILFTSSF